MFDFYKKSSTCNLCYSEISDIVDFNNISEINSKRILNKNELLKISTCKKLNIFYNDIKVLKNIPEQIESLDCHCNKIINFNELLPENLLYLYCYSNCITNLDNLPENLIYLNCSQNNLVRLENLPFNLKYLDCSLNNLVNLDYLPQSIECLICNTNEIEYLDGLPNTLIELNCSHNKIKNLNNLPKSLKILSCSNNNNLIIETLPSINKLYTDKEFDINLDGIKIISD